MKFRKVKTLALTIPLLLCGCNDENKKTLLCNADFLLTGTVHPAKSIIEPSFDEFENLINSNLNFIVLFTSSECAACQYFEPIIENYIKETNNLVISVTGEDELKIREKYQSKFFGNQGLATPSVFVVEGLEKIYKVNYSSYMKTPLAFKNHMNSLYKSSKTYYFNGEITKKTSTISSFSYIEFKSDNLFLNKISSKLLQTKRDIMIVPNYNETSLSIIQENEIKVLEKTNTISLTKNTTDVDLEIYF